jgi:uncharacterized protein
LFEWDDAKAESNRRKHQVVFALAVIVWDDPNLIVLDAEPRPERRWMAIGEVGGRVLSVVFAMPDPETIRLISARPASKREHSTHAQQ